MEKKVLLITMGGTIAGNVATTNKEGEHIKGENEFSIILSDAIGSIKSTANIDVTIDHFPLCNIDSSDILPEQWIALAGKIKEEYDEFDAFLVTHGTNTMGYTAAALSFSLANLDKPVIITGSQVPAGMPGSDAIMNLENSLRVAVLNREEGEQIKGVIAVFGSHIITGTRVKKSTEFDYDAFKSFGGASIGRIGRIIDIDDNNLKKHNAYLSTSSYRRAKNANELICENEFDMRIVSLTEFPGMNPQIFKTLVEKDERNKIKGFILRAFGAGDATTKLIPTLEYLKEKEIPIVITTQAPNGNSNFQVNEPGQKIAEKKLGIPAFDMSIESQTTKLAWLLAKKETGEITYNHLCAKMTEDIRGEVNHIWEVKM
jgi:L-asparaginase